MKRGSPGMGGNAFAPKVEAWSRLSRTCSAPHQQSRRRDDADQLIKPKAYVVLNIGYEPSAALADELKAFVKGQFAPFKCPRWIEFVAELPKTATGKILRFKLRQSPS